MGPTPCGPAAPNTAAAAAAAAPPAAAVATAAPPAAPSPIADEGVGGAGGSVQRSVGGAVPGGADEGGGVEKRGAKKASTRTRGAATSLDAFEVTWLIVLERGSRAFM